METEACFLFVAHIIEELPRKLEGPYEIISSKTHIQRACMQRRDRSGERYKRIRTDFDPLEKQICYVVICLSSMKDGSAIFAGHSTISHVCETEEEAKFEKTKIENGDYRNYLEAKHKLENVEIVPALITKD